MLEKGQKFQKLTVIKADYKNKKGDWYYLCQCECGNQKSIRGSHLKNQKDCGNCRGTNGLSGHELYPVHNMMLQRCYNSNNKDYENYGGRGITVCDRWRFGEDGKVELS